MRARRRPMASGARVRLSIFVVWEGESLPMGRPTGLWLWDAQTLALPGFCLSETRSYERVSDGEEDWPRGRRMRGACCVCDTLSRPHCNLWPHPTLHRLHSTPSPLPTSNMVFSGPRSPGGEESPVFKVLRLLTERTLTIRPGGKS